MRHNRPSYYDLLGGKPFLLTLFEDPVRIHLQLLATFLKGWGTAVVG